MAIKASGGLLEEMTVENGYSIVDYSAIQDYLKLPDGDEDTFTQKIKSFVIETNNRPSIETGFHAQLGKCVVHTHSVYANILTCSKEGKEIARNLFPEAVWIGYATPGRDLTLLIRNELERAQTKPSIIFLQNHGMIATGEQAEETLDVHENVNQKIQNHFNLTPVRYEESIIDVHFMKTHVLFPDQVVYTLAGQEILATRAAKETLWAYGFIMDIIKKLNLTPQFIPQDKAEILLNMESEKFRQGVLKK